MVKRITDLGLQVGSECVLPCTESKNQEKGHAQGQMEAGLGCGHQPRKQRPRRREQNWRSPHHGEWAASGGQQGAVPTRTIMSPASSSCHS